MNALIFAAGLGTRLRPLTNNTPKALIEINGKPLLWYAINQVKQAGIKHIVINVHHFADQIIDYVQSNDWGDCHLLISDEREQLLDTGGGLLKAAPLFIPHQPVLMYNADILCDVDLKRLIHVHNNSLGIATLLVNSRKSSRYLLFNSENQMVGWHNETTNEFKFSRHEEKFALFGFCGVHLINFDGLNLLGKIRKFSITDGYLDLARNKVITNWELPSTNYWFDVGTVTKKEVAELYIKNLNNLLID